MPDLKGDRLSALHERMASALLDQLLFSSGSAQILVETRHKLKDGRWDKSYVDRIGQTQRRWTPEQDAAFLRVHAGLLSGEFAVALLEVGTEPAVDEERRVNAQRLERISKQFQARLDIDQVAADADGELWWTSDIHVQRAFGPVGECPSLAAHRIPAGAVPLEVGLTYPSRTLMHLVKHGGVARWPYRSKVVALFVNTETLPGGLE